jgi:hypothetical protein
LFLGALGVFVVQYAWAAKVRTTKAPRAQRDGNRL